MSPHQIQSLLIVVAVIAAVPVLNFFLLYLVAPFRVRASQVRDRSPQYQALELPQLPSDVRGTLQSTAPAGAPGIHRGRASFTTLPPV